MVSGIEPEDGLDPDEDVVLSKQDSEAVHLAL
jgi:hypothetical protein